MRDYLIKDVLPFWLNNAIDEEFGGIFTQLDREGNIYGEEKSVWFQGRALYIFSMAYNCVEKNEAYLAAAKKIYEFLPKCSGEDGRMFFTVTRDGREIQKRRYYFSETFAAIGCAEYYLATKDEDAWEKAEKYFDIAYSLYSGKQKSTPKFNPETIQMKSLSPAMIMLSTAQVMWKIDREKYDTIAKECTKEILLHLNSRGLLENVSPEGDFVDTPTGRIVNPGHSLEAAWFLMAEGIYQKDEKLTRIGKDIIDISMRLGLQDGGIIAFCDCDGKPPQALEWDMKLWWPQCEAMIANRLCYSVFGEEKYLAAYNDLKAYTETYFRDKEYGEWYGYLHYDNTPSTTLKGNIFKGPFHLPRMLILIDKIEKGESVL
ncbi:MAG: AGE family epimerase/isomerase [Clostridia bacterium]|nr:AGE family epimerase/isomerase [Clostridia bacterium]